MPAAACSSSPRAVTTRWCVRSSADGHEAEARLPAEALGPPPDVVVVVRADPAAAVLAALERRARLPVAPVIVLSGAAPAKVRASLLRAGAHTCLQDPVDPGELLAAVAGALAVKRSRDADPEPEGLTDPVTGLGNRRLGERELDLFVARSTRHGHALSLVKAGIDGFGALAPEAVDAVLHDAGARLARTLRSGDVIVRWERDEFLMMLPDTDRDGTHRAAERLRRAVSAAPVHGRRGDRRADRLGRLGGLAGGGPARVQAARRPLATAGARRGWRRRPPGAHPGRRRLAPRRSGRGPGPRARSRARRPHASER